MYITAFCRQHTTLSGHQQQTKAMTSSSPGFESTKAMAAVLWLPSAVLTVQPIPLCRGCPDREAPTATVMAQQVTT